MQARWLTFWTAAGAVGDPKPAWNRLASAYAEPHRAYHTLEHIAHCLEELDRVRELAADPVAVEMAIWYHDAVYDTRAKDNEQKCADWARADAESMGLAPERRDRVERLILASTHQGVPADPDARLFTDLDLSILGQPPVAFDEYERKVRVEYGWVPEPAYRVGRSAILRSFLERPTIYATEAVRSRYETQARINLAASLNRLKTD